MLDKQLTPHCLTPAISVKMPCPVGHATSIRAARPTYLDSGSGAGFLPLAGLWAASPPRSLPPPPLLLLTPPHPAVTLAAGSKGQQVRPFAVPAAFPLPGEISGETLTRKASSEGKAQTFGHR